MTVYDSSSRHREALDSVLSRIKSWERLTLGHDTILSTVVESEYDSGESVKLKVPAGALLVRPTIRRGVNNDFLQFTAVSSTDTAGVRVGGLVYEIMDRLDVVEESSAGIKSIPLSVLFEDRLSAAIPVKAPVSFPPTTSPFESKWAKEQVQVEWVSPPPPAPPASPPEPKVDDTDPDELADWLFENTGDY